MFVSSLVGQSSHFGENRSAAPLALDRPRNRHGHVATRHAAPKTNARRLAHKVIETAEEQLLKSPVRADAAKSRELVVLTGDTRTLGVASVPAGTQ